MARLPRRPRPRPRGTCRGGGGELVEFKLPDIGEGIAEGEIVQWLVDEGATVEEHQPVVEVMTDKATVEVPAPAGGTVVKRLVDEGATVPVGDVIFHLQTGAAERLRRGSRTGRCARRRRPGGRARRGSGGCQPARVSHADGKVLAVPSARRVARELGVDLMSVSGSGRGG